MGMDMHTCILYVHTHVSGSLKGARDVSACKGLCVCMIVGFGVCLPQENVEL
jgi:hypothetical protein